MLASIEAGLKTAFAAVLIDELLAAYQEAKKNFFLGGLRLSAVEGGRFSEAAYRMLEQRAFNTFTPLGQQLNTEGIAQRLINVSPSLQPDAVRIHIPRALRVVYDIRNKRDNAHLADGIDPNTQDATLVIGLLDWILAEFVRLHHSIPANDAQRIISQIVVRRAPAIEDFSGHLKVLKRGLKAGDHCLLLLYECGTLGASLAQLSNWALPTMRKNLERTLDKLVNGDGYVHFDGVRYFITRSGISDVEQRRLFEM